MDLKNFKPCFLIAMPELQDPNFARSVVLLTDYTPDGVVGFVINRPSTLTVGKSILLSEGSINPDYQNTTLWVGGPVETSHIWMLYDQKNTPEAILQKHIPLDDGIALAKDLSLLINHELSMDPKNFRVMHGYSGWNQEQLHLELVNSLWITAPLSRELMFETPHHKIWENAIQRLGFNPDKLMGVPSQFLN